jgi:benzoate-CoA ligase family protein
MGLDFPERYNATVDLLDSNLEAGRAAKTAIRTAGGTDLTYAEVAQGANRLGNALRELGIEQENRVLIALLDTPEFATTFFGAIKIGAVPIPVNTSLKPQDFAYFLNDSRAKVAVVSGTLAEQFRNMRKDLRHLKHLVVVGEADKDELSFSEITKGANPKLDPADTSRDDMCFWLYSSGTTGFPKGVVHLQHDMRVCVELYAKPILGMSSEDVTFSVSRLYFAFGLGNALYFPFAVGGTTVLLDSPPTPAHAMQIVKRFRPTLYFAPPTSYANTLAADPELWEQADYSSVRLCVSAGEPLSGSILERWKARTETDILDGIGTTECCHIFISNRPGDVRPDCSGKEVPGYEARLVDEHGTEVPEGEIGNLLVKGESTLAFYWNQHERTKKAILGEWIATGDKYIRDADGYLYYQGRTDDMLKVGGIWVSPVEVESCLNSHDAVLESAVVGIADTDHLVHAEGHIVLKPGQAPSLELEEDLRVHVRQRIAHFKCPRDFRFVESLPKTATGKIQRYKLRMPAGEPASA